MAKFVMAHPTCPWLSIFTLLSIYQMECLIATESLWWFLWRLLSAKFQHVFALPYNLTEDKHSNWRFFTIHRRLWYNVHSKALRFALLYSLVVGVVFGFGGWSAKLPAGDYFMVILILLVGMIPAIALWRYKYTACQAKYLHGWTSPLVFVS